MLGVASSPEKATPNLPIIAFVCERKEYKTLSNQSVKTKDVDFVARMISMGKLHGAYPGTGAICTAGAAKIEGTVVNEIVGEASLSSDEVRIGHPGGVITTKAIVLKQGRDFFYAEASIGRTARRLAEGFVLVPEKMSLK
jgi:hypothetical protein